MDHLLELTDINLKFNNQQILKNFSLKLSPNDKVLIRGNSGKGKSTIFRILMGFEVYDSGRYSINKKDISEYSFFDIRKNFAYVDQEVSLRKILVKKYLEEIAKFNASNFNSNLNLDLCKYFEFDLSLLDKDIQKLSGGEKQRLAIIIAIMLDRPIFLLDEVTSALDMTLKNKVVDYFSSCDKCVVSISHDDIWLIEDKFRKVSL